MTHCICLYDADGNFMTKRCFSCKGCAMKRMPKQSPACLRVSDEHGKIVAMNDLFKQIKDKVK